MRNWFQNLSLEKALRLLIYIATACLAISFTVSVVLQNLDCLNRIVLVEDSSIIAWATSVLAWSDELLMNFATEMLGAILTIFIFDLIIGRREKRAEHAAKRREAQLQARSRLEQAFRLEQEQAKREEIQSLLREFQERSLLSGMDLKFSDLKGIYMSGFDLSQTDLSGSELNGADLSGANLSNSRLIQTNLNGANLRGTDLTDATLNKAVLDNAMFDNTTILPDGSYWHRSVDISQFTGATTTMESSQTR